MKRVRDFSQVRGDGHIDTAIAARAFQALGIDDLGLEGLDREILMLLIDRFKGGPGGDRYHRRSSRRGTDYN